MRFNKGQTVRAVTTPRLGENLYGKFTVNPGMVGVIVTPVDRRYTAYMVNFNREGLTGVICYPHEIETVVEETV